MIFHSIREHGTDDKNLYGECVDASLHSVKHCTLWSTILYIRTAVSYIRKRIFSKTFFDILRSSFDSFLCHFVLLPYLNLEMQSLWQRYYSAHCPIFLVKRIIFNNNFWTFLNVAFNKNLFIRTYLYFLQVLFSISES